MKTWHHLMMAAALAGLAAPPVHAELGGPPTWPAAQSAPSLQSRALSATALSYRVIDTMLPSGTLVREFTDAAGTVFGIAWHGPKLAPLNKLLGAYFPTYLQAVQAHRAAGHGGAPGPASVRQAGLVVQSGGHMGAFTGRAYLPDALPQGVSPADIQ